MKICDYIPTPAQCDLGEKDERVALRLKVHELRARLQECVAERNGLRCGLLREERSADLMRDAGNAMVGYLAKLVARPTAGADLSLEGESIGRLIDAWRSANPPSSPTQPDIPSAEEALEIAQRFIDGHFGNPSRPGPRISIPARPDLDDDIRLTAFIKAHIDRP